MKSLSHEDIACLLLGCTMAAFNTMMWVMPYVQVPASVLLVLACICGLATSLFISADEA